MNDPYSVLNVSPNASDEEIKKAYRELARKYHPDNYVDNPLADLASEKMKEVNEAYDAIQRMRGGKSTGASGPGGGGYSGYSGGGYSGQNYGGQGQFAQIRQLIAMGNVAQAEQMLRAVQDHNAEWNFLMGAVSYRKGWLDEAQRYYETACQMDPSNQEYAQALNVMRQGGRPYNMGGGGMGGTSPCDCCSSLICADCCCECTGGDLIPCC